MIVSAKETSEGIISFIKNQMGGAADISDKQPSEEGVIIYNIEADQFHEISLLIQENLDRSVPAVIVIHPIIKNNFPRHWAILHTAYKHEGRIVNFCWTREAFERSVEQEICRCGLDAISKLKINLRAAYGVENVDAWLNQFRYFGVQSYGSMICKCIHIVDRGEIRRSLGISLDNKWAFSLPSVLKGEGSDLEIIREFQSVFGSDLSCKKLTDRVEDSPEFSTIDLIIDTIHSGEQLREKLNEISDNDERLIKKIIRKKIKVRITVVHYTTWGLHRFKLWLDTHSASHAFDFNFKRSIKTDNLVILDAPNYIKEPELKLKLIKFGYDSETVTKIVSFAKKVGAQLKQSEDSGAFPDESVGLGGYNLGVTTMICGHPGKAVLPVIRLKGQVKWPAENGQQINWLSLVSHSNTSGLG